MPKAIPWIQIANCKLVKTFNADPERMQLITKNIDFVCEHCWKKKTLKFSFSGLDNKKIYCVKIRVYKLCNVHVKKIHFSSWSATKHPYTWSDYLHVALANFVFNIMHNMHINFYNDSIKMFTLKIFEIRMPNPIFKMTSF